MRISVRTGDAASALARLDDGEAELAVAALPGLVLQHSSIRSRLHQVPPSSPGELSIGVCVRRTDLHRLLVAAAWAAAQPIQEQGSDM
ncbi:hypothetical protein ACWIID_45265 [Streptomyces phaeochromogenes]